MMGKFSADELIGKNIKIYLCFRIVEFIVEWRSFKVLKIFSF
jgi:hypothetical protein